MSEKLRIKSFINHPISQQVTNLFLVTNGSDFEYVTDGPADVALFDSRATKAEWDEVYQYPASINVCIDLAHAGKNKVAGWGNYEYNRKNYVLLECRDPAVKNHSHRYIDFIFNRTKAYYVDKLRIPNSWYSSSLEDFELWPINPDVAHKTRLFVSPNKLLRPDLFYRLVLADLIQHRYNDLGYFSNLREYNGAHLTAALPDSEFKTEISTFLDQKFFGQDLVPQCSLPGATTVKQLFDFTRTSNKSHSVSGYHPVHNAYYNETYFSVYCETIEVGGTVMVTEKTFDPLIKGHFILPFGSAGTVEEIQRHEFQLPDFIDYSYDSVKDDYERFYQFTAEFERLASLSMEQWNRLWVDNQHILHYNRDVFFRRNYHRINLKNLIENPI